MGTLRATGADSFPPQTKTPADQAGDTRQKTNTMAKKAQPATAGNTENAGATPAAAPIRPPKKTETNLRVEFTRDEIVELALKQGEAFNELNRAEEDKKAVTAQLKAKCEGISARISEITGKLTSGFEYRTVPCETRYDDPKPGLKTMYRLDTGGVVNVDPMTLAERQAELDLSGKAPVHQVLTEAMFDFTPEQVHVDDFDESTANRFADYYRSIFIDFDGDVRSDDDRHDEARGLIDLRIRAGDANLLVEWIKAKRPHPLPGADIALALIEAIKRDTTTATKAAQSKERLASRKLTPGTVEVPADEGSRDDAGDETKND